ncbi:MAG TPA: hypothetical protein VK604_18090, partial [Bryobacteraceae bacterium]|nr:hypothetical protein [Bryobacteraceae bacterium]
MGFIHSVRHQLQNIDNFLSKYDHPTEAAPVIAPKHLYEEVKTFLRSIDVPDEDARSYRELHIERIARTL